jgi:hypothetical protein
LTTLGDPTPEEQAQLALIQHYLEQSSRRTSQLESEIASSGQQAAASSASAIRSDGTSIVSPLIETYPSSS